MNRIAACFIICFVLLTTLAMRGNFYDVKKGTAEVDQYQGVYVFTDSKPVSEYEYLGTVKLTFRIGNSGQYQSVRDVMIKKAKKDYPEADGIIMIFKDGGTDRADAIKFK